MKAATVWRAVLGKAVFINKWPRFRVLALKKAFFSYCVNGTTVIVVFSARVFTPRWLRSSRTYGNGHHPMSHRELSWSFPLLLVSLLSSSNSGRPANRVRASGWLRANWSIVDVNHCCSLGVFSGGRGRSCRARSPSEVWSIPLLTGEFAWVYVGK